MSGIEYWIRDAQNKCGQSISHAHNYETLSATLSKHIPSTYISFYPARQPDKSSVAEQVPGILTGKMSPHVPHVPHVNKFAGMDLTKVGQSTNLLDFVNSTIKTLPLYILLKKEHCTHTQPFESYYNGAVYDVNQGKIVAVPPRILSQNVPTDIETKLKHYNIYEAIDGTVFTCFFSHVLNKFITCTSRGIDVDGMIMYDNVKIGGDIISGKTSANKTQTQKREQETQEKQEKAKGGDISESDAGADDPIPDECPTFGSLIYSAFETAGISSSNFRQDCSYSFVFSCPERNPAVTTTTLRFIQRFCTTRGEPTIMTDIPPELSKTTGIEPKVITVSFSKFIEDLKNPKLNNTGLVLRSKNTESLDYFYPSAIRRIIHRTFYQKVRYVRDIRLLLLRQLFVEPDTLGYLKAHCVRLSSIIDQMSSCFDQVVAKTLELICARGKVPSGEKKTKVKIVAWELYSAAIRRGIRDTTINRDTMIRDLVRDIAWYKYFAILLYDKRISEKEWRSISMRTVPASQPLVELGS